MSDFGRRFDASELGDDVVDNAAAAELLAVARDLETYARSDSVTPSVDFEDRVMAAIANEPPPRPMGSRGLLGIVGGRPGFVASRVERRPTHGRPGTGPGLRVAGGRGVRIAGVACGRGCWRAAVAEWTHADRAAGSGADTESVSRPESEPEPEPVRQPVAERHAIGVTDGDGRADRDRRADRDARRDRRFLGPGIRIGLGERLVRAGLRRRDGATDRRLVRARIGRRFVRLRFGRRLVRLGFRRLASRSGLARTRRCRQSRPDCADTHRWQGTMQGRGLSVVGH